MAVVSPINTDYAASVGSGCHVECYIVSASFGQCDGVLRPLTIFYGVYISPFIIQKGYRHHRCGKPHPRLPRVFTPGV